MKKLIFDDEYSGKRYTYQLNYRPLNGESVPAGWIIFSHRPGATKFGTVDYPFELPAEQVEAYQLTPLTTENICKSK